MIAAELNGPSERELADEVGEMIYQLFVALQQGRGVPTRCILGGAFAQIAASMHAVYGAEEAAHRLEDMAKIMRKLPPPEAVNLAALTPMGTA